MLLVVGRESQRTKGVVKVLAPKCYGDATWEIYFGGWSFCNSSIISL